MCISLMWLHSNMWTTPQAFQNYDKKNAAFIYRLHKVSILQEHSAIRAYFAVTTSIRYTYTFFFLMFLSDVFECIIYFTISKFFFSRACITQVQQTFFTEFSAIFSAARVWVCAIRCEYEMNWFEKLANEQTNRAGATLRHYDMCPLSIWWQHSWISLSLSQHL